jgi:hypothetical protein
MLRDWRGAHESSTVAFSSMNVYSSASGACGCCSTDLWVMACVCTHAPMPRCGA